MVADDALVRVLLVVVGVWSLWSAADQREASEAKVLGRHGFWPTKRRVGLCRLGQDAINYNSDGRYDFKGVYCSVAGKSIALNFSRNTDCAVRYTRENPRTGPDAPDAFEAQALASFEAGGEEFYGIVDEEGVSTFRYLRAIP
ncbi:MAG: DUF3365 domain-containing protein, partial [Coriobacteriaceae bacterium]